jgi:O-antigen ligase
MAAWFQFTAVITLLIALRQNSDPSFLVVSPLHHEDYRPSGAYQNPNTTGMFLLFSIMLSGYCKSPIIKWIGRFAAVGGIYLSASRGAIGILAVIVAVDAFQYAVQRGTRASLGQRTVIVVAVLAMVGGAYVAIASGVEAAASDQSSNLRLSHLTTVEDGTDLRTRLAQEWFSVVQKEPFFGYGYDATSSTYCREFGVELGPHNMFLGVWADAGFLALVFFCAMVIYYAAQTWMLPMARGDKTLCVLLWAVYVAYFFKGHNALDNSEFMELWAIIILVPHALRITHLDQITNTPARVKRCLE